MLIVNKVPTEKVLARKRKKGEKVGERDLELEKTFKLVSERLDIEFRFKYFLEVDDNDEEVATNNAKYDDMRRVIWACSSMLDASGVKSWDSIVKFYAKNIDEMSEQELRIKMETLELGLEDKLKKIEFDIADIKYPFLKGLKDSSSIRSSLKQYEEFVSRFECGISEEDYWRCKNTNSYITLFVNTVNGIDKYVFGVAEKVKSYVLKEVRDASIPLASVIGLVPNYILEAAEKAAIVTFFSLFVIRTTSVIAETAETFLFYNDNRNIVQRLSQLGCRREALGLEHKESKENSEGLKRQIAAQKDKVSRSQALRRELKESKENSEGWKRQLAAQKDKVSRLQASLKNPFQKSD
jgi:hypothetical protein